MPNALARDLAHSEKGRVEAAAGCGKTHLIAQVVAHSARRQLVLTHTHAGVRAILDHLRRQQVPSALYRVTTLDGFALKYAASFPRLSGWSLAQPSEEQWSLVPVHAKRVFDCSATENVLKATYGGILVDEYQDCTRDQHELIKTLARVLPCRVFGDPLQAIFGRLNASAHLAWMDVAETFPLVQELSVGHRWLNSNPELGQWLSDVRVRLRTGSALSLSDAPLRWVADNGRQGRIGECLNLIGNDGGTVVGIHAWPQQCHALARNLRNRYVTLEDVEGKELLHAAERISTSTGVERVTRITEFVKKWQGNLPAWVTSAGSAVALGTNVRRSASSAERLSFYDALVEVRDSDSLAAVHKVLSIVDAVEPRPVTVSREVWKGMIDSLGMAIRANSNDLHAAAWRLRDRARRIGRFVPRHCLSTTLLVKGLQFDRALVLDVSDFHDPENLYVALTRGAMGLSVISRESTITRSIPLYERPA